MYTVFGNNQQQQPSKLTQVTKFLILPCHTFLCLDARQQRPEEQALARIFMVFTLLMILWLLVS